MDRDRAIIHRLKPLPNQQFVIFRFFDAPHSPSHDFWQERTGGSLVDSDRSGSPPPRQVSKNTGSGFGILGTIGKIGGQ